MIKEEVLYHASPYFKPFPAPDQVFANDCEKYLEYLLPLASVDLSHFSPDFYGEIHFVCPMERRVGMVGELTKEFHSYLCRTDWIGFHLNDDSKYSLAADFRYLFDPERITGEWNEYELAIDNEFYDECHASYERERQKFIRDGILKGKYANVVADLVQLGGHQGPMDLETGVPCEKRNFFNEQEGFLDFDTTLLC